MRKLFIFSDVHSFYEPLMTALDAAGFEKDNPDHIIVSLGDLCDRGPDSVKVLKFINSIPEDRKHCIIGNHELMMEEMITRGYELPHDIHNGTVQTVRQLTGVNDSEAAILEMQHNFLWNLYKRSWITHAEIEDMIFVHGWIPCNSFPRFGIYEYAKNWRKASVRGWEDATWYNGMKAWSKGVKEEGKTIFCGHWHTSWGHANLHHQGVEFLDDYEKETIEKEGLYACYDPFVDEGIVALDACTVISGKVNVVVREISSITPTDSKNQIGA